MLTAAEYNEATRNKVILENKIAECDREITELERIVALKTAEKEKAIEALKLYTVRLTDDITQYEESVQVEEPAE